MREENLRLQRKLQLEDGAEGGCAATSWSQSPASKMEEERVVNEMMLSGRSGPSSVSCLRSDPRARCLAPTQGNPCAIAIPRLSRPLITRAQLWKNGASPEVQFLMQHNPRTPRPWPWPSSLLVWPHLRQACSYRRRTRSLPPRLPRMSTLPRTPRPESSRQAGFPSPSTSPRSPDIRQNIFAHHSQYQAG